MAVSPETLRLARKLRIAIDAEVDGTVRQLVKAWARAWDAIHEAWAEAAMDLAQQGQNGQWPDVWTVARNEKAALALLAVNDELVGLATWDGITITDAVGNIVGVTPEWEARIIASQMPGVAGTRAELIAKFNRVDPVALSAIVERTTETITARGYHLGAVAQEQMRRALVRGIALGDNPRKAALEMVRRSEGTFYGGLNRALTIARTEMLDAHRSAAAASQFANADVLTGWTWLAQLDGRTCPSCWAMHGTEHNLDEVGPKDHQQGRCARLPKTKTWAELGYNIPEPASVLPDAQAVFRDLPRADQLTIMGPGRLRALDKGIPFHELSQRRMTFGWRDSWAPTPARDLLRRVS